MKTRHKVILTVMMLLWLGLTWLMLDLGGFTLYNLLWAAVAGGFIMVPLYKKWRRPDD